MASSVQLRWSEGLGGVTQQRLFSTTPGWIDAKKPPGYSSQTELLGFQSTLVKVFTLEYFIWSPNLVWFAIALAMHLVVPYDIEAAHAWNWEWPLRRLAVNFAVSFAYYGYFFAGLYRFGWATRKFAPGSLPTAGNMAHNMYYWALGILQWTCWECIVMRLWATGQVPYVTNAAVLASPRLLMWNLMWVLLTPIWRDLHFYIAHRFIHIRAIYRFVHSLHHRNQDPEPFSGITMHPVEHLYYYSNALTPTIFMCGLSPLIFVWIFIHLTLAPAAGHSGWEDHFQSDQYHYLHHAKFECNYGSPFSGFIDQWCGTFRESLGDSTEYKGEWSGAHEATGGKEKGGKEKGGKEKGGKEKGGKEKGGTASRTVKVWSRDGYLGLPADGAHGLYSVFWVGLWILLLWGAVYNHGADRVQSVGGVPVGKLIGAVVGYAPIGVALVLCAAWKDRMSWRWPFQKESIVGTFGLFGFLGWLACVIPVVRAVEMICA